MSFTILVVEDEEEARNNYIEFLAKKEYHAIGAPTLKDARNEIANNNADIILLDVNLPDGSGLSILEDPSLPVPRPPIIVMTAFGNVKMAVDAMKNGAFDFIQKPIQFKDLEKSLSYATERVMMNRELSYLRQSQQKNFNFIVGQDEKMHQIMDWAHRAAVTSTSVLITGATGTGKENLAKAIYQMSPRNEKSFIALNCAYINSDLIDSELFGHEAGAFTSANERKVGLLEVADGGILFLDEISAMPEDVQGKLLRFLQERDFRRVGGLEDHKVDVHIIAASNRDLDEMIANGDFREDLFYRLKVLHLDLPPLKYRKEDIPALIGFFLREFNSQKGVNIQGVTPNALEKLSAYDWPGNIRELRNVIERAVILCDEEFIDVNYLPNELT